MKKELLLILMLASFGAAAKDDRYCPEPDYSQTEAVEDEFKKIHPLPSGTNPHNWELNYVIPLKKGGCVSIINLQWLPKIMVRNDPFAKSEWDYKLY